MTWTVGPAPFEYGDAGLNAQTEFPTPAARNRNITHYFRHEFTTAEQFKNLTFEIAVDDGAVVWLDGEIVSFVPGLIGEDNRRLPENTQPPYRARVFNPDHPIEAVPYWYVPPALEDAVLPPGNHVVAVEVHQESTNSSDMGLEFRFFQNVDNAGVLAPGDSPGTLTVLGDYVQIEHGTLHIEIGGHNVGSEYDMLRVSGHSSLAGTLDVSLLGDFSPTFGDRFTILELGFLSGAFDEIRLPELAVPLQWYVEGLYNDGSLLVVTEPSGWYLLLSLVIALPVARKCHLSSPDSMSFPRQRLLLTPSTRGVFW